MPTQCCRAAVRHCRLQAVCLKLLSCLWLVGAPKVPADLQPCAVLCPVMLHRVVQPLVSATQHWL
jgi:hypothetical protein